MTNATEGAPAPKKRSFFKRAAWQDTPTKDGEDMFSHANEFNSIVAEESRREKEKRTKAEEERKRKQAGHSESKRRKVSLEHDAPVLSRSSGSRSSEAPPDSLSSRYNKLAESTISQRSVPKDSAVIDLDDSDDDDYTSNINGNSSLRHKSPENVPMQPIPMRSSRITLSDDDDDVEETLDPSLAALAARARERAANRARAAAAPTATGEIEKAPIAQLFISPEIPEAKPLMVKVRIDSTLEKTRLAWCGKQGYSPEMTKNVFFTWRGTRVYDSTTIKRLGIQVDANGAVSIEGDSNIYDDENLPKVHVKAWTDTLFQEHKKQEAAEAEARKRAAETPPVVEEREPTPEPAPTVNKIRLILKAKGKEDFKLVVKPDTTFGHIADAYKQRREVAQSQPITLMFDGDRLAPLDTIGDSEIEDLDAIDVLFK